MLQQQLLSRSFPASLPSPRAAPPRGSRMSLCLKPPPNCSRLFAAVSSAATSPLQQPGREELSARTTKEDDGHTSSSVLLPNALRRLKYPTWRGGFSLGVDLGHARTGLALGKGFALPRALAVVELRGQKLELRLMEIAQREEVDEFIVGLPRSWDGKETAESNKVRSIAGRLAVRAAERGWRVYLQDEYGTSAEALNYLVDMGYKKSARRTRSDSYAAVMILDRYFSMLGRGSEVVLPKHLDLQEKLRWGSK